MVSDCSLKINDCTFKKSQLPQIENMRKLGMTDEEICDCLINDSKIDHGERVYFDLPVEKEKEAKKMANVDTKTRKKAPTIFQLDNTGGKRSRKENPTKGSIIAELAKFLESESENDCKEVIITNKERQIVFKIGENDFELTLVQKRKPKN